MNTNNVDAQLNQAIALVQTGNLETGRRLLAQVLAREPDNADAWLWLSTAVDSQDKRAECLRRVLSIDPNNKAAWERLAALTSDGARHDRAVVNGSRSLEFPCSKCGSEFHYSIEQKGLVCDHCGHFEPIRPVTSAEPAYLQENPVFGMVGSAQGQVEMAGTLAVKCGNCGSTTTRSVRQGTVQCPFCGTDLLVQASFSVPVILPQGLVLFQVTETQARDAVARWWASGWFRPTDLPRQARIQRLRGVYIPFWTFDDMLKVAWFEKDPATDSGESKMEDRVLVDDALVCGSYTLPEATTRGLEPFNTKAMVLYQPEYLAGWPAEVAQISLADASLKARERMSEDALKRYPPGAEAMEESTAYMTFKHIMLPVWVGAYRYQGHVFHFAVNGQTARVSGAKPRSLALLFDALSVLFMLIPLAAILFMSVRPAAEWRQPAILASALAIWMLVLVLYVLSKLLGWRDIDISQASQ